MLSVFQWISQGNKYLDHAKEVLRKVSLTTETLFFELGCNSGKSSVKTKMLNHLSCVYYLLKDNTVYEHIKLIGTSKLWGNRRRYLFICSKNEVEVDEGFNGKLKLLKI
jgi:hypothetical protein